MPTAPDIPHHERIGELFTDIHRQAHEIAGAIPVFDASKREEPDQGEIYSHQQRWQHPLHQMPVTATQVRIATTHSAPYLLEVLSLHPEGDPNTTLPCDIRTFNHIQRGAVEVQGPHPSGLIEVKLDAGFNADGDAIQPLEQGVYPGMRRLNSLNERDRECLDIAATSILGIVGAIRHLLEVDIAERQSVLENLTLPPVLMSYSGSKTAVDPRFVEIQMALAARHPELADKLFDLNLLDPEVQLVLALGDGIVSGSVEVVDAPGETTAPSGTSEADEATIQRLTKDLLNTSDLPPRQN